MTEQPNAFRRRTISQHVEANGLRLHYLDWGEGPSSQLILLHGLGSQAHVWDAFAEEAHSSHRILALDLRGHGDSSHAADGYTLERFAADVKAVARHMNVRSFHLLGHSLGALVAIRFAAENPGMVRKLVLEDGGPGLDLEQARSGSEESFRRPVGLDTEADAMVWLQAVHPHATEEALKLRFTYGMRQNWADKWIPRADHELYWLLAGSSKVAEETEALWGQLQDLRCPALLLRGQDSTLLSQEAAQRIVEEVPQGRLEEVPGAGHSIHTDQPALFRDAVLAFLAQ
ncbi:MAG: alpha/beta hydrolase [Chloroflexi bacterium]|nr:alpha/beta hydrolase [Chloroflexota bacterium]